MNIKSKESLTLGRQCLDDNIRDAWLEIVSKWTDERGTIYSLNDLGQMTEDKVTVSKPNVFRGFHGDFKNDKLVSCLNTPIWFSMIDMRLHSHTFLKQYSDVLFPGKIIYVPRGVINAHYNFSNVDSIFFYKWSYGYIEADEQISVNLDSPEIEFPGYTQDNYYNHKDLYQRDKVIRSDRDKKSLNLKEVVKQIYGGRYNV